MSGARILIKSEASECPAVLVGSLPVETELFPHLVSGGEKRENKDEASLDTVF